MRSITLHFDDTVFEDLVMAIRAKRLAGDFSRSVPDMVNLAIIEAVQNRQPERTLRYRKHQKVVNAIGK